MSRGQGENVRRGAVASARRPTRALPRAPAFVSPLPSKLGAPRAHVRLVQRRVLLDSLRRAGAPLVLLSAAAGWGKTTALLEWTAGERRPVAWLRLDAADNDPVLLLVYLAAVLDGPAALDPSLGELLRTAVPPVWERVVPALTTAIAAAPPFLLVLDDAQHIANPDCWRIVQAVLDCLPEGGQVAICTRIDPPLPLARLRAEGAVAAFGGVELAFDRTEARELLELLGLSLSMDHLDALLRSTEGWATGLYLAAAAIRGRPAEEPMAVVRGDLREIAGYLLGEVLSTQTPDMQDFLLRTSVVEHLSAPLCHAVTGRHDAQAMLSRLADENLFVSAQDDRGRWYRYHHLFGEFLRAELERREPDCVAGLCRRAGEWYLDKDDVPRGVVYLLQAGEAERAAEVVAGAWTRYWENGQSETVRRMLQAFGDEQILAHVALTLTAGWVYSAIGDRQAARRWMPVACRARVDDGPSPDGAASLRSSQALLRAALAPDGVARMRQDAELAARLENRPGSSWYAEAQFHLGAALWLSGVETRAVRHLQVAASEGAAVNQIIEIAALGLLSIIAGDQGQWEYAGAYALRADERLAELGFGSHRRTLPLQLARARLLARAGDDALVGCAETIATVIDAMVPIPWMTVIAGIVVGECFLEVGEIQEADVWSARALAVLKTGADVGMLDGRLQRLRLGLKGRSRSEPISPAELRVLALLPTHLTLHEMAERLCVSTNTVKTHSKALYRKLGVGSRAEAVEEARVLGLLQGP
jgi:LuxR family transcriptional regulator, maltose regulon positive regulatory protein